MKPTNLFPENYLDLIFFNRNKNYGAYALRKNYLTTVLKSLSMVLGFIVLFALYAFLHKAAPTPVLHPNLDGHHFVDISTEIVLPPKPTLPTHPPIHQPHIPATTIPHIVHDELVTTKPDEHLNTTTTSATTGSSSTSTSSSSTTTGTTSSTTSSSSTYVPIRWAEEMPKFQGDINTYLANHIQYPEMAKSANIQGKVVIEFVVNEDGSVSNLRLVKSIGGGCDEEALNVVKNMPHWLPGKQNGSPVKIYMLLPITFTLN